MSGPFTLLTWNINGIRARLDGVLTYLAEREPDVVLLQEIKCEEKQFPRVPFMELGYQVALNGAKGYAGVATLTKAKPDEVIKGFREPPEDSHCRILNVLVGGVRIYNLYVPNGTALGTEAFAYKLQWLERLRLELDANSKADEPLLLCGDFNIAPDARDLVDPASMVGCTHFSPEEHAALARLQGFGLRDCFASSIRRRGSSRGLTTGRGVSEEPGDAHRPRVRDGADCTSAACRWSMTRRRGAGSRRRITSRCWRSLRDA
jgi:exodeoxyribonuclease-3